MISKKMSEEQNEGDKMLKPELDNSTLYFKALGGWRVNSQDYGASYTRVQHAFSSSLSPFFHSPNSSNRIDHELNMLRKALPCEAEASIFVAFYSNSCSLMEALISGAVGTPYAHGLYLFAIMLQSEYPRLPPLFKFMTTANGSVTFAPNLYADGHVCLSILEPQRSHRMVEYWNGAEDSLYRVLVSIQSLSMCENILGTEPDTAHLPQDGHDSVLFAAIVRYCNIKHAMIEMLREPPYQFREVVALHFKIKQAQIREDVDRWVKEAETLSLELSETGVVVNLNLSVVATFRDRGYYECMREARDELFAELDSLI